MIGLVIFTWAGFAAAALSLIGFLMHQDVYFLVLAFSAAASGVLFQAIDRIVTHLGAIARNASDIGHDIKQIREEPAAPIPPQSVPAPSRSIAEIERDIQRLKGAGGQ